MYQKLIIAVACIGLTGGVTSTRLYAADTPAVDKPAHNWRHPGMHRALEALFEAQTLLATAAHDFAGYRRKAMRNTEDAIKEVETALKVENDLPGRRQKPTRPAEKDQSPEAAQKQMRDARRTLVAAQAELHQSRGGFEGHRESAGNLIREALKNVDDGLAVSK